MSDIVEIILKDTFTLPKLNKRVRILRSFLENRLFASDRQTSFEETDLAWLKNLGEPFLDQFNQKNIYEILTETEDKIKKLAPLIIYLPFPVNDQSEVQIGSYMRKLFPNIYLFDPKFDPNLIAGCAFSWKGVLKDYSLRARVEEKKAEVLSGFKKYLR